MGTALIILTWVLFYARLDWYLWVCILLTVVGAFIFLFGLTFIIYFFNLDMKLTSKLQPLFIKHYEKRKRERKI